jgi:hypothetical protein
VRRPSQRSVVSRRHCRTARRQKRSVDPNQAPVQISLFFRCLVLVREMRSSLRALAICILQGLIRGSRSLLLAQNARDIMSVFGAIMQSTIIQATQAEWGKLPSASRSCVDETLRQRGISLQALISDGITPSDSRISSVLMSCRSQAEASQQFANTRFQPTTEGTRLSPEFHRTMEQPSKYKVDKIPLGSTIPFESANYKEYQCRPSDQFSRFTWCQKQRTERAPRGTYLSSSSILHTEDGRVFYLNRSLEPAFLIRVRSAPISTVCREHLESSRAP